MAKNIRISVLFILVLVALLAGCAPDADPAAAPQTPVVTGEAGGAAVSDYETLLAALQRAGIEARPAGGVDDPLFPVEAFSLSAGDARLAVYEFPSEAAAAEAAATVNATGTIIGTIIVDWVEPPHFYRQGRLIALYAGEDQSLLAALATALGEPFVAGEGGFAPPADSTGSPSPQEPVALTLRSLQVEVGVGSPIPVHVTFDADWPSLCAQLATITQEVSPFRFDITVFAHPGPADCPPDRVGLGYGLRLPLNVVELPEGTYTVTVNGLETTFDVPVNPSLEPASPTETPGAALCPEVPRPALALFLPGEGYIVADPDSDASCQTTLGGDVPGRFEVAGDTLFYAVREDGATHGKPAGDHFFVKQLGAGGAASILPFTAVPFAEAGLGYELAAAGDQRTLAWSAGRVADDLESAVSQLWLADLATGDVWTPLPEAQLERADAADSYRMLAPIRFSEDGNILYYTLQPVITDRLWHIYGGRYDNVYALRLRSEAPPELLFDCAEQGLRLCIGDFQEIDGQVVALAYVTADNSLVIRNGAGETLNTISVAEDYVGAPLFGPGGELVFYGATIEGDPALSLEPAEGTLYRVAPPTAQPEMLAQSSGLRFPRAWFDESRVVVDYAGGADSWGTALVSIDGELQIYGPAAAAGFVAVLRSDPAGGQPEAEVDPHTLARQIVEQTATGVPAGWQVQPCEGEAPTFCVGKGAETVGYAELLIFPLTGYPEEHPVRVAARDLPAEDAVYTSEQAAAAQTALTALIEEYLASIAADRAITYPEAQVTALEIAPARLGPLPALTFGFVHTDQEGMVVERYLSVAAFDRQHLYWLGANYDPANVSTFVSDAAVTDFAPFLGQIAAALPVYGARATGSAR